MNWCLSYIILYVPSGSSLLQGLQAFGTIFETWTDYKGLELSGCFKSTILDRFLQEWLNMEHTPFLIERENSGSQSAVIHLSVGLGAGIFPTFSKVQWNSGCWSDLAPNFPRLNGFTNLSLSELQSLTAFSRQPQRSHTNYRLLFEMQPTTSLSRSHGKCG